MIKHYTDGVLFYEGRELRIVAYDVSRTHAQVHGNGLGLLPIHFYITLDGFLTVAKCRLLRRWQDDISVAFERWLDIRQRIVIEGRADVSASAFCASHDSKVPPARYTPE